MHHSKLPSYATVGMQSDQAYARSTHPSNYPDYPVNPMDPYATPVEQLSLSQIHVRANEPMLPITVPSEANLQGPPVSFQYVEEFHSQPVYDRRIIPVEAPLPQTDNCVTNGQNEGNRTPKPPHKDSVDSQNQKENSDVKPEVKLTRRKSTKRETWNNKIDFLLAVIGFAVDLGNIWRFPFICYRNGGGAFLIPYLVMYILGGLPLFYLELALGQYQRTGCLTVWKRICPMFSGIGFGICVINSYTAWYYNTIMAWSLFYMFDAMKPHLPWDSCNNWWNTKSCVTVYERLINYTSANGSEPRAVETTGQNLVNYSSTEEYFYRRVLQVQHATGYDNLGPIRWEIALCLAVIFIIVYFSLWKGVKSSGKAVWITATLPYVILSILLVRGLTLEGSFTGIKYYLTPNFASLLEVSVWSDAASQIFFSLGPGFGVLLALSSYNKRSNNCYSDAMLTSFINCATSFLSGFVVFSVLGHMCFRMGKTMEAVANEGPGLVFIAYPEAIATLKWSTFWAIIFMLMLITLGLDSTFCGLESVITGVLDRVPRLKKHREWFVLVVIIYCYLGALPTTTHGGYLILNLLDHHGAPISILFIVFCECVALCWFYGTKRFCNDIKNMLGFEPGKFWQICWSFISPLFLLSIFIANLANYEFETVKVLGITYEPQTWVVIVAWLVVFSSLIFIPIMMVVQFLTAKGTCRQRLRIMITPEAISPFDDQKEMMLPANEASVEEQPDSPQQNAPQVHN